VIIPSEMKDVGALRPESNFEGPTERSPSSAGSLDPDEPLDDTASACFRLTAQARTITFANFPSALRAG
jgi:hypothetical protein